MSQQVTALVEAFETLPVEEKRAFTEEILHHRFPLRLRAESLRAEFTPLAEQWRRDSQHLSLISKKVMHPAYFRIMGMGEAVVPLLLEELRDRPSHWFLALKSTANVDPVPPGGNPASAREAWLQWGRTEGLID